MNGAEPKKDGRRARRERGRAAVVDATIELIFEGHIPPSVDEIADRSGVSVASIYRYFPTLDDLRDATAFAYFDRFGDLYQIPDIGEGPLQKRVRVFVDSALAVHDLHEPMANLLRLRAPDHPGARDLVERVRSTRSDQIQQHFDPELSSMTTERASDLVLVIATIVSFESWDTAQRTHQRSGDDIRRAWAAAIERLLA